MTPAVRTAMICLSSDSPMINDRQYSVAHRWVDIGHHYWTATNPYVWISTVQKLTQTKAKKPI